MLKKILAQRNKFRLTLEVPRDIITLLTDEDRYKFKISSTVATLWLLHRDTKIQIDKPLKIANSYIVGRAIGVLIVNSRFKKEVYNFRESEGKNFHTNKFLTIKDEMDETLALFDCLRIKDRRVF